MKITVIGAGHVGSTLTSRIAEAGLGDVILLDILGGVAKGKAEDINDSVSIIKGSSRVTGTSNYKLIKGSKVIIITAGLPRQPGMTRQELLKTNLKIVSSISSKIKKYCIGRPIVIVVTNPLDIVTYVVLKKTGLSRNRVFGMAGALDCGRLTNTISKTLNVATKRIEPAIIGPHNNNMIILGKHTKVNGKSLIKVAGSKKFSKIASTTSTKGAYIVSLLGKGSAYFAPSQGVFTIVRAIAKAKRQKFYTSCYLKGEYGLKELCIGVPVIIGKNGIEKIVKLSLDEPEKIKLDECANTIRDTIKSLKI